MALGHLSNDEIERIKRRILQRAEEGCTLLSAARDAGIDRDDLRQLRAKDQYFDLRIKEARWKYDTGESIIAKMYGSECDEGHLNNFLLEYHNTKSLPGAIAKSTLTPSTFKRLTNPDDEAYHEEFAHLVTEIEQMHLLEMDDDLRQRALKGDAATQKWLLERLDPRYQKKTEGGDPSVFIFTNEKLSHASHTLLSLARRSQGGEEGVPRQRQNGRPQSEARPGAQPPGVLPRGGGAAEDP